MEQKKERTKKKVKKRKAKKKECSFPFSFKGREGIKEETKNWVVKERTYFPW